MTFGIGIAALILAAIGVYYSYRQYQIMREQRAPSTAIPVQVVSQTLAPEPAPRFITQAEFDARVRDLRMEYEFKGPTPEGAQRYLQEGWERDEISGHPIVMGGTLQRADNWIIRRRPAAFGLSEAAVAALVAMRRNTYRQDAFEYISGGPIPHLVTSVQKWQGDEAMLIREQLLSKGLVVKETQEYNYYILTELGRNEAERLLQAGASTGGRRITWI